MLIYFIILGASVATGFIYLLIKFIIFIKILKEYEDHFL